MSYWFWLFIMYSFFGYCLEKVFAYAIHSPRQVRKCFLLLPLCPVYGLSMVSVLLTGEPLLPFWIEVLLYGSICTLVEYAVHIFYDKVFHIRFWDYSDRSIHLSGRICPHFSLVWGILSALAVQYLQPVIASIAGSITPEVTFAAWLLLALDTVLTATLLYRFHNTELLSLPALLAQE